MANKNRLLFLLKYLLENTDDNRSVTSTSLQHILTEAGCTATSRTIRDDISTLAEAGYDVIVEERPGVATSYHIGARTFEKPELQILVDAVSSSRFISVEKSRRLIDKLIGMAGISDIPVLRASHLVAQKVKTDNQSLYYIIEIIDQAISEGRKIDFQYETYGPDLEKTLRNGGEHYIISPFTRVWSEDRYYLLGWSDKRSAVVSFRIDHMRMPVLMNEKAHPIPADFDASDYSSAIIRMFEGERERVTLRCDSAIASKLIDRFGRENIEIIADDETSFTAVVPVAVSITFYGWLLQYAGQMRVLAPAHVQDGYRRILQRALDSLPAEN